ncbi:MAG: class I SAM-dependent methyltransferase [Thermoplasmata archaeon HGW-Thermoplasmata-1]|nr:MAG: class I SAM-dependent methyltransferase [Thermoplasmata archaeon HGW-Thermoplasmata-1]
MTECGAAWDDEYAKKGAIWRGRTHPLPELPAGSAVLELGCGNGKTLSAMMSRGWRVRGIDCSQEAIRLAEENVRRRTGDVRLAVCDAGNLPFSDSEFDAVFAFHVIGHAYSSARLAIAREAYRVLRPGGLLFFREFSRGDMRFDPSPPQPEDGTLRRQSGIICHYFTRGEVLSLFEAAGFRVREACLEGWEMKTGKGEVSRREEIAAILEKPQPLP